MDEAHLKEMMGAVGAMASESARARVAAGAAVSEIGAGWLAPHYLFVLRQQLAKCPEGPKRLKLLRQVARDVVAFQRGGVWSARVELEREKLEFQKLKHKDKVERGGLSDERGKRGASRPLTDEELKACVDQVDEIMGLKGARN